ncbi:MAG: hypothetical protein NTV43_06325 [Methylococcales bacterium]|nr:hypothetical protein [Methylococcales bacterium]
MSKKTVTVSSSPLLVPLAKSKKLAALRDGLQQPLPMALPPKHNNAPLCPGLSKEANSLLTAAQEQIDLKIATIMATYPSGKQNKLFALRYGSPESIKKMPIKAIFAHLGLAKTKRYLAIENRDYFGTDTLKPPRPSSEPNNLP